MPPKAPAVSPVPGISLVAPESLVSDFRKFKNDQLFFISFVRYFPSGDSAAAKEDNSANANGLPKPIPRVFALTPAALFVCDTEGQMDRATRVEYLDSIIHEVVVTKKFFGSDENMHIVVKVPQEMDIMIAFDKEKDNKSANEFLRIIKVLYEHKNGKPLTVCKAGEGEYEGKNIFGVYNSKPAEGYLSPKEIIAMNQARAKMESLLGQLNQECDSLQENTATVKKALVKKREELKSLEAAAGSDVTELRRTKDELSGKQAVIHRQCNDEELEVAKLKGEAEQLRNQLKDEQEQFDTLVSGKSEAKDDEEVKLQEEAEALRRNHRKKEIAKGVKRIEELKAALKTPPTYQGPENITSKAVALEEQVQTATNKWERDMEAFNRMERMFDASVSELKQNHTDVMEVFEKKKEALARREAQMKPPEPEPTAAATSSGGGGIGIDDDDDLLGGSPPPPAKASSGAAIDDDDDLLGGGGSPAPAPKPSAAPIDDDDDLLGGGGGGGSTPPPPVAATSSPPPATKPPPADDDADLF